MVYRMSALAGTTGILGTLQTLLTGIPLSGMAGYVTLMILTVFPITGVAGLNLVAVNQPLNAFFKLFSVGISVLLMVFIAPFLPLYIQQSKWLTVIAGLGPWYMFDIIQMLLYTDFQSQGFKPIFPLPFASSGGTKNSSWNLTSTFVNLFLVTIAGSAQVLKAIVPDIISPSVGNWISIASGSLLGVSALGSLAAVVFGPTAAPLAAMVGGANSLPTLSEGNRLPPLSEFIDKIGTDTQEGGSGIMGADRMFLSVLAFVAVTGIALGFARSKPVDPIKR